MRDYCVVDETAKGLITCAVRYDLLIFLVNSMSYWTARLVGQRILSK